MQRHWVQRVYRPTEYILWTCLHFTSNLDVIFYKISTDFKCKHSLFLRGSITKYIKSIHLHYIHLLHIIYGVNNPCSIYKNLSLINTIIFFPSQDKLLSCQFWMVTKWYKSQIMAHYKWHLCFKTVFCQHWWDKKSKHFCKYFAPNEAHTQVSLTHMPFSSNQTLSYYYLHYAQNKKKNLLKNGLVPACDVKVIRWFDQKGSHLCHMWCPALVSGNTWLGCNEVLLLYWALSQLQ